MIRALIVDDEQPARDRLRQLLSSVDGVDVVGEACDGDQAVQQAGDLRPDLLLLDIQMPVRNGLEVAKLLTPPRPKIIFCTAFDHYALDAFEQQAVDYLLKPVRRDRLAQAVSRARESLEPREMTLAALVQARMLPKSAPLMSGLDFSAVSHAARSVGGDYYDFFPVARDVLAISIAHVSGKGLSAGLLMANLQGRLQSRAPLHQTRAGELVSDLNRTFCGTMDEDRFISLFYSVYDTVSRTLTFVNAGHPPPFLFRNHLPEGGSPAPAPGNGGISRLTTGGPVLGILPNAIFDQESIALSPGDVLLFFSDGVSEAMNAADEEFGEQRLGDLLAGSHQVSAHGLAERIVSAVRAFSGPVAAHDDSTLMVLKVEDPELLLAGPSHCGQLP